MQGGGENRTNRNGAEYALVQRYKDAGVRYRDGIKEAQTEFWKDISKKLDKEIWGHGYRIMIKRLKGLTSLYDVEPDKKVEIIKDLFLMRVDVWQKSKKTKL